MKQIFNRCTLLLLMLLGSCGPRITISLTDKQPALSIEEKVALLDVEHSLPDNTQKIGDLRYQDSGFSTDCSFNSLLNQARLKARKNGANIVKVVAKKKPDLWSSCYRLKIELHKYNGDVAKLPQYELQLD